MDKPKVLLDADLIVSIIETILSRMKPDRIVLYGSRANGSAGETSDIDLAVFGKDIPDGEVSLARNALEERVKTPLKMDLVHFEALTKEKLKEDILKEGVCLYESEKN